MRVILKLLAASPLSCSLKNEIFPTSESNNNNKSPRFLRSVSPAPFYHSQDFPGKKSNISPIFSPLSAYSFIAGNRRAVWRNRNQDSNVMEVMCSATVNTPPSPLSHSRLGIKVFPTPSRRPT